MRSPVRLPARARRAAVLFAASVCALLAVTTLVSCKPASAAKPASGDTGMVTESFSVQGENNGSGPASSTAVTALASGTVSPGTWKPKPKKDTLATATPANPNSRPDPTPVPGTTWPAKVAAFAKEFKKPVWYPAYVPKGYVLDSIDVVELDPGTGLVCSIVFTNEKTAVQFTQGSPTNRTYPIVSLGKVAWGSAKADIMHQDPADTTSPLMVVYSYGGNFAEVSGDAPTAELKAVAASMKPVTY